MRLAPVPIFYHHDIAQAREAAAESSFTTHPGPIAAEACKLLAHIVVRAMELGGEVSSVFDAGERKQDDEEQVGTARQFLEEVTGEYLRDCLQVSMLS